MKYKLTWVKWLGSCFQELPKVHDTQKYMWTLAKHQFSFKKYSEEKKKSRHPEKTFLNIFFIIVSINSFLYLKKSIIWHGGQLVSHQQYKKKNFFYNKTKIIKLKKYKKKKTDLINWNCIEQRAEEINF